MILRLIYLLSVSGIHDGFRADIDWDGEWMLFSQYISCGCGGCRTAFRRIGCATIVLMHALDASSEVPMIKDII